MPKLNQIPRSLAGLTSTPLNSISRLLQPPLHLPTTAMSVLNFPLHPQFQLWMPAWTPNLRNAIALNPFQAQVLVAILHLLLRTMWHVFEGWCWLPHTLPHLKTTPRLNLTCLRRPHPKKSTSPILLRFTRFLIFPFALALGIPMVKELAPHHQNWPTSIFSPQPPKTPSFNSKTFGRLARKVNSLNFDFQTSPIAQACSAR